jgi:hypothetical protein
MAPTTTTSPDSDAALRQELAKLQQQVDALGTGNLAEAGGGGALGGRVEG